MSTDAYIHTMLPGKPGSPLLFAFHGTGGDEHQLVSLASDLKPGATIVAPRGDVSEFGAARFFRRTAEGVYDLADLARATGKMAGFVKAHVAAAMPSAAAAEPSAVAGLGYSNGANILASVIFAEPGLFDAAVLMHPLIPFAPQVNGSLSGKRLLITAGRHDPICPPNLTTRLDAHLRAAGADVTLEWHEGGHELRPNEIEAARRFLAALPARENASHG
jgi:phospholipase/carboxylesterase